MCSQNGFDLTGTTTVCIPYISVKMGTSVKMGS